LGQANKKNKKSLALFLLLPHEEEGAHAYTKGAYISIPSPVKNKGTEGIKLTLQCLVHKKMCVSCVPQSQKGRRGKQKGGRGCLKFCRREVWVLPKTRTSASRLSSLLFAPSSVVAAPCVYSCLCLSHSIYCALSAPLHLLPHMCGGVSGIFTLPAVCCCFHFTLSHSRPFPQNDLNFPLLNST